MSRGASGRTWDDAESPEVARLLRRFETDWRAAPAAKPDPRDYLPAAAAAVRPATLLALLRLDLVLRWETGQRVEVEWYLDRDPALDGESLLALLYEEFCLREEAGESPRAEEYDRRFPTVAASFREVLEIHSLVGRNSAPTWHEPGRSTGRLPEAGQSMGGFRLVEELGRGAFARVFLARERELADRLVALKVTRTGSREPQTLARLQHTHIVPVYSYRTEPGSGLHLLCMPYLGRVTLAEVLGAPAIREARSGADLLAVNERLQRCDQTPVRPQTARSTLAAKSYARAIAWWGARLAEALQHAHDREVLHRDVKPSNILLTADGLPMLLDFNLAQESWVESQATVRTGLGGTLAYMAPEHLEALAEGKIDEVDARSDLYALGVVLFECLVRGSRTLALPSRSASMAEAMLRTAEARRRWVPRVRDTHRDVPEALEAVVRRCLAPDPDDRYQAAVDLAADLQAVADDGPLRFAREPWISRTLRWGRRHRGRLALAVPLLVAIAVATASLVVAQLARLRLDAQVSHEINEGRHAIKDDQLDLADGHFTTAAHLAEGAARLRAVRSLALKEAADARRAKEVRVRADELFALGERLRFALHGFGADARAARSLVESALGKFSVVRDRGWMRRPSIELLDRARRARLLDEVDELLFLWVVALDRERPGDPRMVRQAARICDAASSFATPDGPWSSLRRRYGPAPSPRQPARSPASASSARACYQWGLLADLEDDPPGAIAWFERATRLEPGDYWSHFFLGYHHERAGHDQRALEHYQAAVSLRPDKPWARNNRALLYSKQGEWGLALDDLNTALDSPQGRDFLEARLNLGLVQMVLGDVAEARSAFDTVIDRGAGGPLARAARLNRARLDAAEPDAVDRAWAEYDELLAEDPRDSTARLGRALLALRHGRAAEADRDLTLLLRDDPERADELFAHRALARLAQGRRAEAESDASDAYRRKPTPSRERLWMRMLLAQGRAEDLLWIDDPDDLDVLPGGGRSLGADLRSAADRLGALAGRVDGPSASALRTRAVLLSALGGQVAEAESEATRAIALTPNSPEARLVRARLRRRASNPEGAVADVDAGLALEPGNPRLLELRGLLAVDAGNPAAALVVLNRARVRGGRGSVRIARAGALLALGRAEESLETWSLALDDDPEDPRLYLGRAGALVRLGRWDRALVELDQAADWSSGNPYLLARIASTYAACLRSRPDRFPHWLALVGRAGASAIAGARPVRSD